MEISGWGKSKKIVAETELLENFDLRSLRETTKRHDTFIVRGLGRSYGDSSLADRVVLTTNYNRMLNFDPLNGILHCEAGCSLAEIIQVFLPQGWFLPVAPGTKYVSVGGAIASDVHGKNHHIAGSFSEHLLGFRLVTGDGELRTCSKTETPELFNATCGGMGLTGIITDATIKLIPVKSALIDQTIIKAQNLGELIQLFEKHASVQYSVAWIDCLKRGNQLGRGLLMLGRESDKSDLAYTERKPIAVPFGLPSFALNQITVSVFNEFYFQKVKQLHIQSTTNIDPFFYPLDSIRNWNLMYGKPGFYQYQFAIPKRVGSEPLVNMLSDIASSGQSSFLAVLKYFGPSNNNYLSFPMEGLTLAVDFKANSDSRKLMDRLDQIVGECGGRVYLAKDARMSAESFRKYYPNWEALAEIREQYKSNLYFNSVQSRRLGI